MAPRKEKHRIPYDNWINSQLSVAKYYGGITINKVAYELDYDGAKTEGEGDDIRYFPDLVAYE